MADCEYPAPSEPLRQGDIFYFPVSLNPAIAGQTNLAVVVTADCDIAQSKTPGFVTAIPIIPLRSYVQNVWALRRLQRQSDRITSRLAALITKARRRVDPGYKAPSLEAIHRWAISAKPDAFVDSIPIKPRDLDELMSGQELLQRYLKLEPARSSAGVLETLIAMAAFPRATPDAATTKNIRDEAAGMLKQLPLDAFLISSIKPVSDPRVDDLGHVALLRYISSVPLSDLRLSREEMRSFGAAACRIARLNPQFKFAFAQRFAHLYSRIGTPAAAETEQREIADATCNELFNTL